MAPTPQISYISVAILVISVLIIIGTIIKVLTERRDESELEEASVNAHIRKRYDSKYGNEAEFINETIVEQIWLMPAEPNPKAKGDALEELTVRIFQCLGYNSWTTAELKAMGTKSPYDISELTGCDQGGDVIAERHYTAEVSDSLGNKDFEKRIERILIQCKAYKSFNEDSGNSTIQATIASRVYYEDILKVKFDKVLLISTAQRLSEPAIDLANRGKIDIYLQSKLLDLVRKANWAMRVKQQALMDSNN